MGTIREAIKAVIGVLMRRKARRIACPVCGGSVDSFDSLDGSQYKKIDSCPNCGVSLDERMSESPEANEAAGLTRRVRLLRGTDDL